MKYRHLAWLSLIFSSAVSAAEHTVEEEIVVTAAFEQLSAESSVPINALSGETLQRQIANTLGDTLRSMAGVQSASFGPGVGLPVIRGQSGNRVRVLQNSANVIDASRVSQDHNNAIEPLLAERLEVIRGPSTLLYGSGAIGGVVNVIDGRIPDKVFDQPEVVIEQSYNDNSSENKTLFKANGSAGIVSFHIDGFYRENDDVTIPGMARIITPHDDDHDEDHDDDHDDDDEHHEDEEEFNSNGFIANSNGEASGINGGVSVVGEKGYIGFSVGQLDNDYGLPPGSHDHGHDEEHGDEDHGDEEDHDEDEHEEEETVFIRLDMEQTRYDFAGGYDFDSGFFNNIKGIFNYTDYQHQEIEIEDGMSEVGTTFSNEGYTGRVTLGHNHDSGVSGTWGIQFSSEEFSAIGEEAFIPQSDLTEFGVFVVERIEAGKTTFEVGARIEQNEVDPGSQCSRSETPVSVSGAAIYDLDESSNLLFNASYSQRAPSVEELFSNINTGCAVNDDLVVHAATGLIEIGDPTLDKEVSTNAEIGWRRFGDGWTAEVNAYYNAISDYIYLDVTDQEIDETAVAYFRSQDADFYGFEASLTAPLVQSGGFSLDSTVFGDYVRATFADGSNVVRIPPARIGLRLDAYQNRWFASLTVRHVLEQDQIGANETVTDNYTEVGLYADYHFEPANFGEFRFFVRVDNLLDEEIRNHVSLLKNEAPEAGRAIRAGIRFTY